LVNLKKLRGKIAETGHTYVECAAAIGRSTTTFSSKMRGKISFSVDEANKLSSYLELNAQEQIDIFFAQVLASDSCSRKKVQSNFKRGVM